METSWVYDMERGGPLGCAGEWELPGEGLPQAWRKQVSTWRAGRPGRGGVCG